MDQIKQAFGALFSPISNWKVHKNVHNEIHRTSHVNIVEKNQHHQNIAIYGNSSSMHILPISGSHNRGWMFNDPLFNITNVFQRPIFFHLSQHSLLYYTILVSTVSFFFFFILMILLYFVYYPHRRHRQQQQQQQQGVLSKEDKQLYYFMPSNKLIKNRISKMKFISRRSPKENNYVHHTSITGMHASQATDKVNLLPWIFFSYAYMYSSTDRPVSKDILGYKSPTIKWGHICNHVWSTTLSFYYWMGMWWNFKTYENIIFVSRHII